MGKLVGRDEVQCPYHGLRLQLGRPVHRDAGAGDDQPVSAMVPSYPVVERYRYLWVWPGDLTLADPDLIPDMHQMDHPEWAGDGLTIDAAVQLPADPRQPDGPHPRGVRARQQHRPGGAERVRVPDPPRGRRQRDRRAVDARRRAAAVLAQEHPRQVPRLRGPRRPVADHPLLRAVDDLHRRRRRAGRHRRARGRPQPGRQRLRHEHDHARRPTAPPTTSGRSCATTGSTAS